MNPLTTRLAPLLLTGRRRRSDPAMIPKPDEHGFDLIRQEPVDVCRDTQPSVLKDGDEHACFR
jgi:hypothetical protein